MDWARAFDKVPHNRLISKLHNYGICGSLHNRFHSFLSFRKQRVIFQGSVSDWCEVSSGVPQGSILAPLLFNIFVNDLPGIISSSVAQYADDTIIYRIINSPQDSLALQEDLNNLILWSMDNNMSLNAKKCKTMHITRSRRPIDCSYFLGNNHLELVNQFKYLGVTISNDLSWGPHIKNIVAKASRISGFIRRTVRSKDSVSLVLLFKSLCRPLLEYAVPAWSPFQTNHINALERVQR